MSGEMTTSDFINYLEKNDVKYVMDHYAPIILVVPDTFKESWEQWSATVKELKYNASWGVRADYEQSEKKRTEQSSGDVKGSTEHH